MRISVMPEWQYNTRCPGCNIVRSVIKFTVLTPEGADTTEARCEDCLRTVGEVTVHIEKPPMDTKGPPSKRVKKASQRNERFIADSIGGRTQPGSGNQLGYKGDVRKRGQFRVEAKDSYSDQFILKLSTLHKISAECGIQEKPALIVTFVERHTHRTRERWAVVPFGQWEDMANGTS